MEANGNLQAVFYINCYSLPLNTTEMQIAISKK